MRNGKIYEHAAFFGISRDSDDENFVIIIFLHEKNEEERESFSYILGGTALNVEKQDEANFSFKNVFWKIFILFFSAK